MKQKWSPNAKALVMEMNVDKRDCWGSYKWNGHIKRAINIWEVMFNARYGVIIFSSINGGNAKALVYEAMEGIWKSEEKRLELLEEEQIHF